jgi:hypothetical protein
MNGIVRSVLVALLLLVTGIAFVVPASGCDRYPVRVAIRRVSDGQRVAVRCGQGWYGLQDSNTNDPWPDMIMWQSCRKHVPFTNFVFLVDIDFPMEAGDEENSVKICDQYLGWRDAEIRVCVVDESAMGGSTPTSSGITEFPITTEMPKEGRIVVAPKSGEFPQNSCIVLALDLGSIIMEAEYPPSRWRVGYFARVATWPT